MKHIMQQEAHQCHTLPWMTEQGAYGLSISLSLAAHDHEKMAVGPLHEVPPNDWLR